MGIFGAMVKAAGKEIKKSVKRRVKKVLKQHSIPRNAPKDYVPGKKTRRKVKRLPASSVRRKA